MFVYQMFTDTTYQMFPALRGPSALGSGVGLPLSFLLTFFEGKAHTQVAPSMHQNVPNRPNLFPEYDWLDWNSGFFYSGSYESHQQSTGVLGSAQ